MFHMSAAMAETFVQAATEMTESITSLGPSPLREDNRELDHQCE